jgi:hypothetical protein
MALPQPRRGHSAAVLRPGFLAQNAVEGLYGLPLGFLGRRRLAEAGQPEPEPL